MIDSWFAENLACPRDLQQLRSTGDMLVCEAGHQYPVVDGVPVMLLNDAAQTTSLAGASLRRAHDPTHADKRAPQLYLESLGISEEEKKGVIELSREDGPVDPVVAHLIAATNGLTYRHLVGNLDEYPIVDIPLPAGAGHRLLDVGCSWGRWTIAAATKGYEVVGIDPSLGAVMAAQRVAQRFGVPSRYVVGDARFLPFPNCSFDDTFSYSVIQHFSRTNAVRSIAQMGRVLKPGGKAKVQMPMMFGLRCLYHQLCRSFRHPVGFDVRYWTLPGLRRLFSRYIGRTRFEADCYFGIGLQGSDQRLMTHKLRWIVRASEGLKAMSRRLPPLVPLADSIFVESDKSTAILHSNLGVDSAAYNLSVI